MHPRTAKVSKWVNALSESLWFVPTAISTCGVALGAVLPLVDSRLFGDGPPEGLLHHVVPGAPAAEALLSSALSGLSTILGVAFSLTVVTLQLAATQYTSRLLRRFMADRTTRAVLGVYLATISYVAVVLRTVEQPSPDGSSPGFVPTLSVLLALLAFLACIVLLAIFIHHLSRSIQSGPVIATVGRDTIHVLRKPHPGEPLYAPPDLPRLDEDEDEAAPRCVLRSRTPGYLQLVDVEVLLACAPKGCTEMRLEARTGEFLLRDSPLLSIWPPRELGERQATLLHDAFAFGVERTVHQDVLYGVRQLVDVALKALSPAVNDVHTAVMVVNELAAVADALLQRSGGRPHGWRAVKRDGLTLYLPDLDLKTYLAHAFDELPRAGVDHPIVLARLLEVLTELTGRTADAPSRALLQETGKRVAQYIDQGRYVPSELRLLRKMEGAAATARLEREPDLTNPV